MLISAILNKENPGFFHFYGLLFLELQILKQA